MKRTRLQGREWHTMKYNLKLISHSKSKNGNVRGLYRAKDSRKQYTHWLNDLEKKAFLDGKFYINCM